MAQAPESDFRWVSEKSHLAMFLVDDRCVSEPHHNLQWNPSERLGLSGRLPEANPTMGLTFEFPVTVTEVDVKKFSSVDSIFLGENH